MIGNAAIYCTRVEREPFMVSLRCTLVYLFDSFNALVQAAAPQCWMGERERNEELAGSRRVRAGERGRCVHARSLRAYTLSQ